MREFIEFRIPEDRVGRLFGPDEGTCLGGVRNIVIERTDPRLAEVGRLQRERRGGKPFFYGWAIIRKYTKAEIEGAALLKLGGGCFEPAGEQCGTVFDETSACMKCGVGRRQKSRLVLDLRKAPKSKAIGVTIADEVIFRHDLVQAMREEGFTGCIFEQVKHKSKFADDPIDYFDVPTGRLLIEMAARQGLEFSDRWTFEFCSWLNRPEWRTMVRRADQEHAELMAKRERRSGKSPPEWFQLLITAPPVRFHGRTLFGKGLFDLDPTKEYVCPFGHTKGLTILSEPFLHREDYDGSDIVCTKECIGAKAGVLMPAPLILISQRLHQFLKAHQFKGSTAQVAHLI